MNICVNKDDKTADWNIGGKVITIHNENILYAFEHGKKMLMIKEKDAESRNGFSAYDANGNIIFSYKYMSDTVAFKGEYIIKVDGAIISVDYEEQVKKLIILKEKEQKRALLIYDGQGSFMAEIPSPNDYIFVSLKNNKGEIMVWAQGMSDKTRDSFGRNDWNFSINFENYYITKKSIVQ